MPNSKIYPKFAAQINQMARKEQYLRRLSLDKRDKELQKALEYLDKLDHQNTQKLKKIVRRVGLPTISKVGRKASFNAWLIVQHSPDLKFMQQYLKLLKKHTDDVDPKNIAYLEDRVRLRQGKSQLYGTQVRFNQKTKQHKLQKVFKPEGLDQRRKDFGLEPVKDYLEKFRQRYDPEFSVQFDKYAKRD